MVRRLISRCAEALVDIGRTIFEALEIDPRLVDAAGSMRTTQSELEAKVDALHTARSTERIARVRRDEDHRILSVVIREFALIVLALNGNHTNADPYLKYFPLGFGVAMHLLPVALGSFGRQLLATLAEETDPKILSYRSAIEEALNRFLASEDAWQAAHRGRLEAFALVQAEKRNWVRGVRKARALAECACHYERAYIRSIFAEIRTPRRAPKEAE